MSIIGSSAVAVAKADSPDAVEWAAPRAVTANIARAERVRKSRRRTVAILPERAIVHMRTIRSIALLLAAIVLAAYGRQNAPSPRLRSGQAEDQWPPPLQKVANDSPPLS